MTSPIPFAKFCGIKFSKSLAFNETTHHLKCFGHKSTTSCGKLNFLGTTLPILSNKSFKSISLFSLHLPIKASIT